MTKRDPGSSTTTGTGEGELVLTRIFDASRELVFRAWTDPRHLAQWWGPNGFTTPVCEMDVRPGGAFLFHMCGPDGTIYPNKGMFHEVVPPERLVVTTSAFEDEAGIPQLELRNTVTFAEHDGKMRLTLHAVVVKASSKMAGPLAGMEQGWSQSLDRLATALATAA